MIDFNDAEVGRLEQAGSLLLEAEKRLPVLGRLKWDRSLASRFLDTGANTLPKPVYKPIDPAPSFERIEAARKLIAGHSPVHDWLGRLADTFELTASMMAHVGTADFYKYSMDLYGGPSTSIGGRDDAWLGLANRLDDVLSEFDIGCQGLSSPSVLSAEDLKGRLEAALPQYFGDEAPEVRLSETLSAKAVAGRTYIKLRTDARFSDLDEIQLLQHEGLIHIGTNYNGQAQSRFPILGEAHPGNSRTQEGLAVFAEFISGALDPSRLKRLANRVIAIDMAENGADFIELYNFFRERGATDEPFEAFESARRVVRGGLVEGGAPFTKDSVYLGGLLDVHNYLRTAVRTGDADYIRLLFVGKIDLGDLEAMKMLRSNKLIGAPRFLPPWVADMRHLLSYLAYSTFLNEIKLNQIAPQYDALFGANGTPETR
ncbi:MAG: flavohemoglobin expression-modulating QEGLA motif protein [Hyphomonadaceae bacterium]